MPKHEELSPARRRTRRVRVRGTRDESIGGRGSTFVAIDFETADYGRDSACSVALVRVEQGRIVRREVRLIRPPRKLFRFTHIHGITWPQVRNQPSFRDVWLQLRGMLEGASFLAAHNASFDRSVLEACCEAAHLDVPELPFRCTVQLAREKWNLRPTKLPNVCEYLGLTLNHHDALSDSEACAGIIIAAEAQGVHSQSA